MRRLDCLSGFPIHYGDTIHTTFGCGHDHGAYLLMSGVRQVSIAGCGIFEINSEAMRVSALQTLGAGVFTEADIDDAWYLMLQSLEGGEDFIGGGFRKIASKLEQHDVTDHFEFALQFVFYQLSTCSIHVH